MEKLEGKEDRKIKINENKYDFLEILNMYSGTHFENLNSKNIKPVILGLAKINENLKNVHWIPIKSNNRYKSDLLRLFMHSVSDSDKIIFIGKEPIKTFESHLYKYLLEEKADYNLNEMLKIWQKIHSGGSRYLSYEDIKNKGIIKSLYTGNDCFCRDIKLSLQNKTVLQKIIKDYIKNLSKFSEFSFGYQYDEKNNSELNHTLKVIFDDFNGIYPGFFYGPDEVIPFFKYQMHQLIDKKTKKEIQYEMHDMHFLFDEKSNDNFIKDSHMQNRGKFTNKIGYNIVDTTFEISSVLLQPTPPLEYDGLNDTDKNKLKQIKNRFPDYFFSEKDVLYYIERLLSCRRKSSMHTTGIFCDIDGTLVTDGHINPKVIQKLIDYSNVGKTIQLWTAGNIYNKVELLDSLLPEFLELGLDLEKLRNMGFIDISPDGDKYFRWIENKYDYQGLTPEIVLDDWPVKRFNYLLDIKPQHFINVNSL